MVQEQIAPDDRQNVDRRCPNCGTRVARDAETCFMCGHDLRVQPRPTRRVLWIDALLVLAVLAVLVFWWQMGSGTSDEDGEDADVAVILPTSIPILTPTLTPAPTVEPTPTATPIAPEEVFETHEVQQGETLLTISGQYDTTVEEIQAANGLTDVLIRVGDELIIPVLRDPDSAPLSPLSSEFTYIVKEGDTIVSISILFGSTIQDILDANSLAATDIIRPGDTLIVPVRNVPDDVLELQETKELASGVVTVDANAPDDDGSAIYIEPRLTGPTNRARISRDDPVLLRWVSVDMLAPNEWYVLLIYPTDGTSAPVPTVWTKATSHRLGTELAPEEGESASYSWQVSVIRVLPGVDDNFQLEAASPPSLVRTFTWE